MRGHITKRGKDSYSIIISLGRIAYHVYVLIPVRDDRASCQVEDEFEIGPLAPQY